MRLVVTEPNADRPAKPNTGHGGLLHSLGPPLLGDRMAPSCTKLGAWVGVKGESAGKAEEQETRLFSNLPSKTSRGRGPRASELRFAVYHPNQKVFRKRGCLFRFPLAFTCGSLLKPEG